MAFRDTLGMKPGAFIGIALVVVGLIVGGVKFADYRKRAEVAEDVKSAYAAYLQACEASDAAGAVALLSARSFDHYGAILKLGLDASESQTKKLQPHQMVEVAIMRQKGKRKDLKNLDGRGYVTHAVKNGWWGGSNLGIKDVRVMTNWGEIVLHDQEWADAYRDQRISNILGGRRRRVFSALSGTARIPKPPELVVRMVQEDGAWKVCEAGSSQGSDKFIMELAAIDGMSVTEFVEFAVAEETSDGKPNPVIWKPMK